nr:MAG TPA: hypothetical protein [Caudoviricetes sp.]
MGKTYFATSFLSVYFPINMTKQPRLLSAASYLSRFNIQLNNSSH